MSVNRGVRRHRIWMNVLVLVLAFSTTGCATFLTLGTKKDACMGPKEFARLYMDSWMGPEGRRDPIYFPGALENLFTAIFYAPVASLSYSVENHICHSVKGQPEQGQIDNFFKGSPEAGQPLVPVEAAMPGLDESKITGGNDACTDSEGNLQPRQACE